MGEPIKIVDIVQRYAEMMRVKSPKIVFTGARPGEKISEELFDPCETTRNTAHPRIKEVDVPFGHISKDDLDNLYRLITFGCPAEKLRNELEQMISMPQNDLIEKSRRMAEILSS